MSDAVGLDHVDEADDRAVFILDNKDEARHRSSLLTGRCRPPLLGTEPLNEQRASVRPEGDSLVSLTWQPHSTTKTPAPEMTWPHNGDR